MKDNASIFRYKGSHVCGTLISASTYNVAKNNQRLSSHWATKSLAADVKTKNLRKYIRKHSTPCPVFWSVPNIYKYLHVTVLFGNSIR